MLFTEFSLDERLQRALATAGFETPTPIQAAAIPVALAGRDLVGTAQTGTGKTAAFVLPILQQIISIPLDMRRTRAVILAPTRELVEQTLDVVRELGCHTNVRAVAVYGGVAMHQQTRALRGGVDIVIACPGRLLDHIRRRNTDFRHLEYLVLDEADRMLDMGFLPSIQEIIDYVPLKRQTSLFSATFAKSLNAFVQQTLRDPVRVEVATAVPAQSVRHTLYQVKHSMKTAMLTSLLRQLVPESDSVLIFTRTRVTANEVAEHLNAEGMQVDVLTADKTQRARQDTLDQFRSGVFPYLVATDIAARGIDVTSISHVINFDLPEKADDYLHRIGRTGRMERAGHAISLMTRGDQRYLREIERMLGKQIEVAQLEGSEQQEMHDVIPAVHDAVPRSPRYPATARPANRPYRPHQQDADGPRRAPRADAPPRNERPRREFGKAASSAPSRTERPGKQRAEMDAPRGDRPQRKRFDDAPAASPARSERPRREYGSAESSAAPARPERPGKRRVNAESPRGNRPHRKQYEDTPAAPMSREERRRKQFGDPSPTERAPRQERSPRRRRDSEAHSAPKRRERGTDSRVADGAPSESSRQEQPRALHFTGMASAAKYHRKHAAEKRQPGEVAYGPRPHGKARDARQSAPAPTARTKRPAHRGR